MASSLFVAGLSELGGENSFEILKDTPGLTPGIRVQTAVLKPGRLT